MRHPTLHTLHSITNTFFLFRVLKPLLRSLSPHAVMDEGSAYVNAFNGRGQIGKRSHSDFSKVAMEMIRRLDKELPSNR